MTGTAATGWPFDAVVTGEGRSIAVAEFMTMPLPERVALILKRDVEFRRAGAVIDKQLALQGLIGVLKR
jgi:hypothetical protein